MGLIRWTLALSGIPINTSSAKERTAKALEGQSAEWVAPDSREQAKPEPVFAKARRKKTKEGYEVIDVSRVPKRAKTPCSACGYVNWGRPRRCTKCGADLI